MKTDMGRAGFTLLEVLVVVLIITILATIVGVRIADEPGRARVATARILPVGVPAIAACDKHKCRLRLTARQEYANSWCHYVRYKSVLVRPVLLDFAPRLPNGIWN